MSIFRFTVLFLVVLGCAPGALGQVPEGWYATSQFRFCNNQFGQGRVLVWNPDDGSFREVEGLPDELLSIPCNGSIQGSSSVLVRPRDGAILLGEGTSGGQNLEIFLLELDGFEVERMERFTVGATSGTSEVSQLQFLADEVAVFSVWGLNGGPDIGVLDLSRDSPTVTLHNIESAPSFTSWAVAVDLVGGRVFLADRLGQQASRIVVVEIDDLLDSSRDVSISRELCQLSMDTNALGFIDGVGLIASGFGAMEGIYLIDPETGSCSVICSGVEGSGQDSNALTVNPVAGEFVVHYGGPFSNGRFDGALVSFSPLDAGCKSTRLAETLGLGITSGVSYNQGTAPWWPLASFTLAPEGSVAPLTVSFDATDSRAVGGAALADYSWDFGGTNSAHGAVVGHTYEFPGEHPVKLTVTDDRGRRSFAYATITVLPHTSDLTPWSMGEVGEVPFAGGARFDEGCLVLAGTGGGVDGSSADQQTLIYQAVAGDFTLTARLKELHLVEGRALAGLAIRESLEPDSAFAMTEFTAVFGSLLSRFRRRSSRGEFPRTESGVTLQLPDVWLRLQRRGNFVTGGVSDDGTDWTEFETESVELPGTVLAGVSISGVSRTDPRAVVARVCELSIEGLGSAFLRGDCNDDGAVDISDAVCTLNWLFLGGAAPGCIAVTNTNGDDAADISDATYVLNHLFLGGPAPVAPYPECGIGTLPADDDKKLGCEAPPKNCPQ